MQSMSYGLLDIAGYTAAYFCWYRCCIAKTCAMLLLSIRLAETSVCMLFFLRLAMFSPLTVEQHKSCVKALPVVATPAGSIQGRTRRGTAVCWRSGTNSGPARAKYLRSSARMGVEVIIYWQRVEDKPADPATAGASFPSCLWSRR
jgi:hypothetical protein